MTDNKCCICGEIFKGYGNNPQGALDKNWKPKKFKPEDRCCDTCNEKFVIPGRIYLMFERK